MLPRDLSLTGFSVHQLERTIYQQRRYIEESRKAGNSFYASWLEQQLSELEAELSLRKKTVEPQGEPLQKGVTSAASNGEVSLQEKIDELDKELSKLVGLKDLKEQFGTWAKGMLLDARRRELGLGVGTRKPPHMAFLGNPGTGKTTVARILGKLLNSVGILPTDQVLEVQRTDLVGEYIGQTGIKTREKIEEAEGGILFVDEAYRLVPNNPGSYRDFGAEALDEIMSVMEDGSIMIIFAGYSEPMNRVLSSNEGLRRRVTKIFHFEDFTLDDLAKITHIKMTKQGPNSMLSGFKLHDSCGEAAVSALIQGETTEKQRSQMNGGLVDIMLVNARESLDSRLDINCADREEIRTITLQDLKAGVRRLPRS